MNAAQRAQVQRDMVRLADGDRSAFDALFSALWDLVKRFVQKQVPPSDADDIAQEVLAKIFARTSEFDREGDAVSWTLGIAAYEVRSARKRRLRRKEEFCEPPERADVSPWLDEAFAARQLEMAARETLETLTAADVETLQAVSSGRRPAIPSATFRKRVQRALKRFRLAWRAKHGAD